jgi:hypothetical protein
MSSGLRDFFTKISTPRFFIRAGMAGFARIVVRDYPHRSRSGTQARPADRAPRARTKSAREILRFFDPRALRILSPNLLWKLPWSGCGDWFP